MEKIREKEKPGKEKPGKEKHRKETRKKEKPGKMAEKKKGKLPESEKKAGSIWNPLNLQKEVQAFGYNFRWSSYALVMGGVLLLAAAIGIFFKLQMVCIGIVLLAVILVLPLLVMDAYKRMYEQKRFADVTDYMEQVLYSFRKEHKVLAALRDCREVMADGMMKRAIDDAVRYMEAGEIKTEKGLIVEALSLIEEHYSCEKIHAVHEFLASAEDRGGAIHQSVELLVEDIEVWKRQTYELQKNKKISQTECIFSIVAAAALCGVDMYIMETVKTMAYAGDDVTLFALLPVQLSSLVFILVCLLAFYKSSKKMAGNWLDRKKEDDAGMRAYEYVMNFDERKSFKAGAVAAAVCFAGAGASFVWWSKIAAMVLILTGVFMLFQHRFSYRMNLRDARQALYGAFPEWMFDMALLLQDNNVQVSVAKSLPRAEGILKGELEALLARIRENPSDAASYTKFCDRFDVPEIATCMKMLYSLSESGVGDAKTQIENLIRHVQTLEEKEASLRNENVIFGMRTISFYPVAATSVKMLVDMTVGMLLVLNLFQTAF